MKASPLTLLALLSATGLPLINALTLTSPPNSLLSKRAYLWEDGKQWNMADVMCAPLDNNVCPGNAKVTRETCANNCFCEFAPGDKTKHVISCRSHNGCGAAAAEEKCKCLSKPDMGKCDGTLLRNSKEKGAPHEHKDYVWETGDKETLGCISK